MVTEIQPADVMEPLELEAPPDQVTSNFLVQATYVMELERS